MKKKNLAVMAKSATRKKESRFFAGYTTAKKIVEEGEYYAMVKNTRDYEATGQMILTLSPFDDSTGQKEFFEDVTLFIDRVCSPDSAAGQFLTLFENARHWGDIKDRIVGIELKFNRREGKVYKNIVKVFATELDDLVFDDAHMTDALTVPDVEEGPSEEDDDATVIRPSRRVAAALDDEEDEDDDLEIMEDEEDG